MDNVHPGDILREDFLIGGEIPFDEVIDPTGLERDKLSAILAAQAAVDADADFRLARYLGMSEGFFLRLQNAYDLEEAWRAHAEEFERIPRRAA